MEDTSAKKLALSRRGFLKSTVAVAGAAALGAGLESCAVQQTEASAEPIEDETYQCVCTGNCGGCCCMKVHVREGKVYNITKQEYPEGFEDQEQMCQRGLNHMERIYDPRRLQYPMKRVEGAPRGAGEFERISWDEAIEAITSTWIDLQKTYGKQSIVFSNGSGNFRPDTYQYVGRLINFMGATEMNNDYDQNGLSGFANTIGFGLSQVGNNWEDLDNAKTIFIWGTNVTEAQGVRHRFIQRNRERGAHVVCIDPNFTICAAKSDKFVPIQPGTDALLIMAMMRRVVESDRVDREFLIAQTVAPYLVKEQDGMFARLSDLGLAEAGTLEDVPLVTDGQGNFGPEGTIENVVLEGTYEVAGQTCTTAYDLMIERIFEYDDDQAVELTQVPLETIDELTDLFCDGPTTLVTGYGPDHISNGHTFYHSISCLLMLTGNMAKAGAGVTGSNISAPYAMGPDLTPVTNPPELTDPTHPYIHARYLPEIILNGKYGPDDFVVKSVYAFNANFLGNEPNRQLWLQAIDALDLLVVADVYETELVKYADIVLPVPHYFELESYYSTGSYFVRLHEQAIQPQFESRGDFEIINALGQGMGFEKEFQMTRDEFFTAVLDNDTAAMFGLSWPALKEQKMIFAYPAMPYVHGRDVPFTTPTGKAQMYVEGIRPVPDFGQEWDAKLEALPYWCPPHEAWFENDKMAEYPLMFMSERAKFKVHTQFGYCPTFLEIDPEPSVKIAPADAEERGIQTGDTIRIFNDRGYVVTKAQVSAGNRPGVLIIDHGWQESQFIEGHYTDLSSEWSHPHFANVNPFDCLVQVEKVA